MELLQNLCDKISASKIAEIKRYHKCFLSILSQHQRAHIKIGVVGMSGTGKSTLINAVVGFEIVPASSGGACTPFSIEIGYAENTNQITVLITYISEDSFRDEVQFCLSALKSVEGDGIKASILALRDPDFKNVRDKILSRCPEFAEKDIDNLTEDQILQHPAVAALLGKEEAKTFTRPTDAHSYINTLFNKDPETGEVLWPWIQGAKINLRSFLLKSGIILVDLPGTHDTNSARASATQRHMDDCTALWILTPAVRAANDAPAAELISLALQHSFHLENMSLAIVATKSDLMDDLRSESVAYGVKAEFDEIQAKINELHPDSDDGPESEYSDHDGLDDYEAYRDTGEKRKRSSELIETGSSTTPQSETELRAEEKSKRSSELTETGPSTAPPSELELRAAMWKICVKARDQRITKSIRSALTDRIEEFQAMSLPSDGSTSRATRLNGFDISDIVATVQIIAREQAQVMERSHVIKLLLQIWKLWNGLLLSCSGNAFGNNITKEQLEIAIRALEEQFPITQQKQINTCEDELTNAASKLVLANLAKAYRYAHKNANKAYDEFKDSIKHARTFKAIMLRKGAFTGQDSVLHDLNATLSSLLFESIGVNWTLLFSKKLREIVRRQKSFCRTEIQELHEMVVKLAGHIGCSPKASKLLEHQIVQYEDELEAATNYRYQTIQFGQRETRRRLHAVIQAELSASYEEAAKESGKDSGDNMKKIMKEALTNKVRKEMYEKSTKQLKDEIEGLLGSTGLRFRKDMDECLMAMRANYHDLFGWKKGEEHAEDSRFQLEILQILEKHTSATLQDPLRDVVKKAQPSWVVQESSNEPEIKQELTEPEKSLSAA